MLRVVVLTAFAFTGMVSIVLGVCNWLWIVIAGDMAHHDGSPIRSFRPEVVNALEGDGARIAQQSYGTAKAALGALQETYTVLAVSGIVLVAAGVMLIAAVVLVWRASGGHRFDAVPAGR